MREYKPEKAMKVIWGIVLATVWIFVGIIVFRINRETSLYEMISHKTDDTLAAVIIMLVLFTLKSLDFILHSSVLYASSGILFSLPVALTVNTAGILIMLVPAYVLGKVYGSSIVRSLEDRHPKIKKVYVHSGQSVTVFAMLLRSLGIPLHAASLYMGAMDYNFWQYLMGSILGILPVMIPCTIMGNSISDIGSLGFIISFSARVIVAVISVIIYSFIKKSSAEV